MHVFFITQWYPTTQHPFYGIFIQEHARAVARFHKVSLLHIQGVDPTLSRSIQITPHQVHPGFIEYRLSYQHPMIPYIAWMRQFWGAHQAFTNSARYFGRPDVIHANISHTAGISVMLGRLAKIPVVLSEHSSAYGRKLFKPSQIPGLRFFMNRVDLILPVCEALGQIIREYGISRPMVTVQNVVDMELFYPASAGEQITNPYRELAMVARLSQEKAVHLAIQSLACLQQQGIYFRLHIAGDGPDRGHLETLVTTLGLADWVQFHGNLPKIEVAKILRRASALVLSSVWENQPVVILEALASGLPVVAPAIGGIPEIITPENGMLFRAGEVDDLTSRLESLSGNLHRYDPQAIHKYAVEHYSPDVVGSRLDYIYQQVIKNRQSILPIPGI